MLSIFQPASLLISINISSTLEATGLLELLGGYDVAATWNLTNLEQTKFIERILAANANHEIGILGETSWVGPQAGRGHFSVELQRRIDLASDAGCQAPALACEILPPASHFDLLIKHRISALTTISDDSHSAERPRQLRYGLWQIDANLRLGQQGRGWLRSEERRVRRAIDAAVKQGESCHLSIDATDIDTERRLLQRTLHHADQLCRSSLLQIETVGQTARRLSRPLSPMRPACSILRRAA